MKKYSVTKPGEVREFLTIEGAQGFGSPVVEVEYSVKEERPILSITRRQMKLALNMVGLLQVIEGFVSVSEDDNLKINWYDAINFESDNPLIWEMAQMLGKSEEEVYQIFELGMTL